MSLAEHMPWEDERAAYLLDALDDRERVDFEAHLAGCDRCRAELRWLQPAVDVLPASVEQFEPPTELRDRILGAIEADGGRGKAAPARPTKPPFWKRVSPAALTGVAAVVALAVGIAGGYALRGDSDPAQTVATTVPVEPTAPSVRAAANIVRHDDTYTLDVSHIPDLRPGDVYQVWMRDGEQLQPSILFVPSRDGTAKLVLPAQTGAADEMLVTREPSGGSQEPTSAPLVSATLQ
ncbi:MAG TPA: anti-sigma factor [Thermoleophilaceae bacterium]|nr:anti-sigma factor [Thermoleophilaceae bacterium]